MLRDAKRREKTGIVRQDFRRRVAAVKLAEQTGDGLDDQRIGIAVKQTLTVAKVRDEPQFGEAAGNQIFVHAQFRREWRPLPGLVNQHRQTVLAIFKRGKLGGELNLFFREVHGAEQGSFQPARFFRIRLVV